MRISTRGRYGIRAMVALALQSGQGPIPLRNVAEREEISEHYLEQLMGTLRKVGLVISSRGAQGGYELARPAEEITAGEILRALEGPVVPVDCLEEGGEGCHRSETCVSRLLWQRLQESVNQVLERTTLAELRDEARRLAARGSPPMYYI